MDIPGGRAPPRPDALVAPGPPGRHPETMAFTETNCSSCGLALSGHGATHFVCPDCAGTTIGRCRRCRDQSVAYLCPKCGFEGP
jgi:Zn-ribbon RNA-binding protein